VVLLHTWPSNLIAALPGLLARLSDGGAHFVRLDQLPAFEGSAGRG